MTIGDLIFIIIFLIAGVIGIICALVKDESATLRACFGTSCLIVSFICTIATTSGPKPSAIDVYRGKTTLQITYQDSIAIDTVVVWK